MTTVRRFDRVSRLDASRARRDGITGFLHAPIVTTRTGVLEYRHADGSVTRELKHPDDVFAAESVETAKRIVITDGHPDDFVTSENWSKLGRGHVGDQWRRVDLDGGQAGLELDGTVTSKSLQDKIAAGVNQASMGYLVDIIEERGEYNGQRYDYRHTNIRYNHVAILPRGRCGGDVRLRLDGDAVTTTDEPRKESPKMATLRIDNTDVELSDAAIIHVKAALDSRDAKIKTMEGDTNVARKERDDARARADAAEKAARDRGPDVPLRDAVDVLERAAALVGDAWHKPRDGSKSPRDMCLDAEPAQIPATVRRAVVMTLCADEADKLKGESDDYIRSRFDALEKSAKDNKGPHRRGDSTSSYAGGLANSSRGDGGSASDRKLLDDITKVLSADPLDALASK